MGGVPDHHQRIIGGGSSAETMRFLRETGAAVILKPFRIRVIEDAITRVVNPPTG